jgi:hypothetical protein
MQTNRGVALSDCRCAQTRTPFTPLQRFAKEKLCLSIRAFYDFANLSAAARRRPNGTAPVDFRAPPRTRGSSPDSRVRGNERSSVGWVEPTGPAPNGRPDDRLRETHHATPRSIDGFRKGSTPTPRAEQSEAPNSVGHGRFVRLLLRLLA